MGRLSPLTLFQVSFLKTSVAAGDYRDALNIMNDPDLSLLRQRRAKAVEWAVAVAQAPI